MRSVKSRNQSGLKMVIGRPHSREVATTRVDRLISAKAMSPRYRQSWERLLAAANQAFESGTAAKTAPQDRPMSRFKTTVYEQVLLLVSQGRVNHIRGFVLSGPYAPAKFDIKDNPFHWALFALSKSAELDRKVTDKAVNEIGLQLLYASRHRVPPELLIGFIYQTQMTSSSKQKRVRDDPHWREDWSDSYRQRTSPAAEGKTSNRNPGR